MRNMQWLKIVGGPYDGQSLNIVQFSSREDCLAWHEATADNFKRLLTKLEADGTTREEVILAEQMAGLFF